jgi:hypothetical protein
MGGFFLKHFFMQNKNRYLLLDIRDTVWGESILMRYMPEHDDPKHDDLPSEQLTPGKEYYVTFAPVEKEPEPEFNKG